MAKDKKCKIDLSSTSFVLGILSIVMAVFSPIIGLTLGIIGLVQGSKAKLKIAKTLNIIGIIASVIIFILTIFLVSRLGVSLFPSS